MMCKLFRAGQGILKSCAAINKERPLKSTISEVFGPSGATRTPGLLNPNFPEKLFPAIYSGFQPFSFISPRSLGLFKPAFHRCSGAVCGNLCGQKRSPPGCRWTFTGPRRGAFLVSGRLHCNSEQAVMQVVSAQSATQILRRNKQGINS